jgi:sugar phosphate isomerase/epimerase
MSRDERSPESFSKRVAAVMSAGFAGIGFGLQDIVEARSVLGYDFMQSTFREYAVKYLELEFIWDWYEVGDSRRASDKVRWTLLEAAAELGARHVKVGADHQDHEWPFGGLVRDFRKLCKDAADVGTRIALEPLAFTQIKTPVDAVRLVEAAGEPAGGVLVDIWSVVRTGVPMSSLKELPVELIISTELSDGLLVPEGPLMEDSAEHRRFCGDGEFDIHGFINALSEAGYRGPWGVEMLSSGYRSLPMPIGVKRAYETTMSTFEASEWRRIWSHSRMGPKPADPDLP